MRFIHFLFCLTLISPELRALEASAIIAEAQKAALAKNRKEATEKLIQALRHGSVSGKSRSKVLETLKTLSEMFFTDKGQRLFETGQSLVYDNPDAAMTSFKEAENLEDSNVIITLAEVRTELARQRCDHAAKLLPTALELNPYNETARFLESKILICEGQSADALEKLKADGAEDVVHTVTTASALIDVGRANEAVPLLQKAVAHDIFYPEAHYWLYKSLDSDSREEQGLKYVVLCKNLNARTRRKYQNEPRLCAQVAEVDDAIKKAQNNAEP